MKKIFDSFINACHGICTVWKEERNFRIEILAAIIVSFILFYFHFTYIESALCIIAISFVLCSEIANTAIEDLCNKVEPNTDPVIGKIKDMMGGFVLISSFGAILLGLLVALHHFCPYIVLYSI